MKKQKLTLFVALVALITGFFIYRSFTSSSKTDKTTAASVQKTTEGNKCENNTDAKTVIVSISKRHMWACQKNDSVYNSAVVTGDMNYAADLTPIGTYKIYAKTTDRTLTGSDEKGSWNVHVDYWMPFLDNKYGTYGFHDATWRQESDFGNTSPDSSDASHGCVELPLKASAWLYNWSEIGTTVSIED